MSQTLYVNDLLSYLYRMDCVTGSTIRIGPIGMASVTDIACHGNTIWGSTFSHFLRINANTGAGTVIGPFGSGLSINALNVSSNGTVYGASTDGRLVRINRTTGVATVIGPYGGGFSSAGDLAFDSTDTLYATAKNTTGVDYLGRVNVNTGALTAIGPIGFTNVYGLAFHCCRLYGSTYTGQILSINVQSGAGTLISTNGVQNGGMTSCCTCGC